MKLFKLFKFKKKTPLRKKTFFGNIISLEENEYFVFGSNYSGIHGAGAARTANQQFGAVMGASMGFTGNSYAIVTTDLNDYYKVSKDVIMSQILLLYIIANEFPEKLFYIAYRNDNANLCGYTSKEMAEMFNVEKLKRIPQNIIFEDSFVSLMN